MGLVQKIPLLISDVLKVILLTRFHQRITESLGLVPENIMKALGPDPEGKWVLKSSVWFSVRQEDAQLIFWGEKVKSEFNEIYV